MKNKNKFSWINKTDKPYILGHRGVKELCPENTILSFKKAVDLNCDIIELDVHLSKDKELIVIHDDTVNRTTNGVGYIKNLTVKEIKKLDAGIKFSNKFKNVNIPLLSEVLDYLKHSNTALNIEIKNCPMFYENIDKKVIEIIEKYNFVNRTVISSFDHTILKKIKQINSKIITAVLCCSYLNNPVKYLKSINADGIHPQYNCITKEFVKLMHNHNFFVNTWVVNDKKLYNKFCNWNIDAIGTDNPLKLI